MRYIKDGAISADPWVYIEGDEPVPSDVPAIVSPDWLFATTLDAIASRGAPLGVAWPNDRPESELAPHLPKLSLIALEFPVFRDGRAYSQARRLRERHGTPETPARSAKALADRALARSRACRSARPRPGARCGWR